MRRRIVCGLAMAIAVALCYLKSYEVLPTRASWSGWTDTIPPNNWVGETFTANFDSITEVQVFVGHVGDTSHHYDVNVYENPSGTNWVARKLNVAAPAQGHIWLKFELETQPGQKFVRVSSTS